MTRRDAELGKWQALNPSGVVVDNGYSYQGVHNTVEDVPQVEGEWTWVAEPDTGSDMGMDEVGISPALLAYLLGRVRRCTCDG